MVSKMTSIPKIYQALLDLVSDNMPTLYTKADVADFERIPAIGFGIVSVHELEVIGGATKVKVTIPVVIVDSGTQPLVSVNLSDIYETFRTEFNTKIIGYLTSYGITADSIVFGEDFNPTPYSGVDESIRALGGEVSFIIGI